MRVRSVSRRTFATLAVFVTIDMAALAMPAVASMPPQTTTRPQAGTTTGQTGAFTLKGVAPGPHTITLITGDRVRLSDTGGGRYALTPESAARPDGRQPTWSMRSGRDGVFVIPDDAEPAIESGRLDRELFDIKYLAENGYADDKSKQLPLIVQYPSSRSAASVKSAAEALPDSTVTHQLSSIHGASLNVPKAQAAGLWKSLRTAPPAVGRAVPNALGDGVAKVWLDGKVKATLDVSVPLIGAPQAWANGHDGTGVEVAVLDTGVDATHPDLAGKIADSKSFVPGEDVADGNGHGTHVASTIAGSGAAEGGKYTGVAKGARLVIGKVLNNAGGGQNSWIIDGMEWAASSGAKVVSMSLGGGPTDGTDPVSQAVNDLTASTGTLFVIAAGNSGPAAETVTTPGSADAALTVAATDKTDKLAAFSSRGPRTGDEALKPDIAAPGVHIVAARAAGTSLCANATCGDPTDGPVDDHYTQLSGTSMATPHVAGAAAILAQQHPDWKADRLKAALMSTAKDDAFTVYQQGAGRVDVARADRQKVVATTATLDYGLWDKPDQVAKQVTYANDSDTPVTLTLAPALHSAGGTTADGALTTASTLTVPAGDTATTTVTLNPADLTNGTYTGAILATDPAGDHITTPVGLDREPPTVNLTVHTLGLNGEPENSGSLPDVQAVDVPGVIGVHGTRIGTGVYTFRARPGTYSIDTLFGGVAADGRWTRAWLINPQVTVTGDTEITLDARKAVPITFTTPKPNTPYAVTMKLMRTIWDGSLESSFVLPLTLYGHMMVTPTSRVTKGIFKFASTWTLANPQIEMNVQAPRPITLHPITGEAYADRGQTVGGAQFGYVPFDGDHRLQLLDVNFAHPDDIAGLDLKGKLALLTIDPDEPVPPGAVGGCRLFTDRVHALREAGAVGIVAYQTSTAGGCAQPFLPDAPSGDKLDLPSAQIPPAEGQNLRALLGHGPVTINVHGDSNIDYTYQLAPYENQQIPNSLHYTFNNHQLAQVDSSFHASTTGNWDEAWPAWTAQENFNALISFSFAAPENRTEYFGPLSSDVLLTGFITDQSGGNFSLGKMVVDKPTRTSELWNNTPRTPGAITLPPIPPTPIVDGFCAMCREGDFFFPYYDLTYGHGQTGVTGNYLTGVRLFQGDQEIPQATYPGLTGTPAFVLPKEKATYRITQTDSGNTNTWTFSSAEAPNALPPGYGCVSALLGVVNPCHPEPLIFVGYDLGDSQAFDNTVAAGGKHTFTVNAYHSRSTAPMPPIAGLKLSYSTDDGAHWTQAQVHGKNGTYSATATYPDLADTTGAVSLKVDAWDTAGDRLEQTTTRAFNLR